MSYAKVFLPPSTIGIIGGGQLGRMLAFSAKKMGYQVGILDPVENCPASQVSDWHLKADYQDRVALAELAKRCDLVTYEFENIDSLGLTEIMTKVAVPQGVELLKVTQNRQLEKEFLALNQFPLAKFVVIEKQGDLARAVAQIAFPCVLKTLQGGYDGRGQVILKTKDDLVEGQALLAKGACVLEEWVAYQLEVSVMVARNLRGEISVLPVAENDHRHNILHTTVVPARITAELASQLQKIAITLAEQLALVGLLAIEFFIGQDASIYINELAPRPHNSGHYSIEGCDFSQFDLHILGICNRRLPQPNLHQSVVMVNILGQHLTPLLSQLADKPEWHLHLYGKAAPQTNRKMGHLTVLTQDVQATLKSIKLIFH